MTEIIIPIFTHKIPFSFANKYVLCESNSIILSRFWMNMIRNDEEQNDKQRRHSDTEESVIWFQRRFFGDEAEISHTDNTRDENIMNQKTRSSSDESFFQRAKRKKRRTMAIPHAPSPYHVEVACAEGYARYFEPVDIDVITKSPQEHFHQSYTDQTLNEPHITKQEAILDVSNVPNQGVFDHNNSMTQQDPKPLLSSLSFEERNEIASAIHESLASTDLKDEDHIRERIALSNQNHSNNHMLSDVKRSSLSTSPVPDPQSTRFKPFHEKKWNEQLEELRAFKRKHGNCLVPHTFDENPHLARWVKRQRRQYKLMQEGDPTSTMTQERAEILTMEGFIWDSHEVVWIERYNQLVTFMGTYGHCRVPIQSSQFPQLSSWIKCQRRQYKLFRDGKPSSMTQERMRLLESIGFSWEVRSSAEKKSNATTDFVSK